MPYGYMSPMESFQLGEKTSPAAGVANAIRNIINQHDKMTMMAGKQKMELGAAKELERYKASLPGYGVKKPSWGQEQKVASIREGLNRGTVVFKDLFGQPLTTAIKTKEDALNAISMARLDPSLFANELTRFDQGANKPGGGGFGIDGLGFNTATSAGANIGTEVGAGVSGVSNEQEGQTATNLTTGARMIFRNGEWRPI